jgi:hypothetical protein
MVPATWTITHPFILYKQDISNGILAVEFDSIAEGKLIGFNRVFAPAVVAQFSVSIK